MSDPVEVIDCACYTTARRHPEVLGRIGKTVLPFQVTGAALTVGVGSFVVLLMSWYYLWGRVVPGPLALVAIMVVPVVAGRAAMITAVGGRNPFLAAAGLCRYVLRSRSGVVNGRALHRGRVWRVAGSTMFESGR